MSKVYPETETIRMQVGETIKLRFITTNNNMEHQDGGSLMMILQVG